jgi:hypothetical protein
MIAVVPGGVKENNVGAFFGSGYLHFAPLGQKCTRRAAVSLEAAG